MGRSLRIAVQLALSAAIIGYLLWQIDVGKTADQIAAALPGGLILAWRSARGGLRPPGRGERAPVDTS